MYSFMSNTCFPGGASQAEHAEQAEEQEQEGEGYDSGKEGRRRADYAEGAEEGEQEGEEGRRRAEHAAGLARRFDELTQQFDESEAQVWPRIRTLCL